MRETPFLKELRGQIARARGRVVLTGFIPPAEMPGAYLLGDVFVGPSQIEEGLGLVFLEAAAAGLPVIATRMGGIPEVVRDGETGLLLEQKDDAAELAEKILDLLRHQERAQALGQQGREWVLNNFSWEKIAQTLEGVYDEVEPGVVEGTLDRGLFRGAGRRRRGREAALGRTARLDRLIQGQDIGADGRQHEAEDQPGPPVPVQAGQVNFGAGMFTRFAFMGMFVAVRGHNIFLNRSIP